MPVLEDADGKLVTSYQEQAKAFFDHFAEVEAAEIVSFGKLLEATIQRQEHRFVDGIQPVLQFVTTRFGLERSITTARSGTGTGLDIIPYEVLRLSPNLFSKIMCPLAMKTTILLTEPVQHKGGQVV